MKKTLILLGLTSALTSTASESPIVGRYDPDAASSNFLVAVSDYVKTGNCISGAVAFAAIANEYPLDDYTAAAKDLSAQLKVLMGENEKWKEPPDWKQLPIEEQIRYHIFHLRDLHFVQDEWPDECNVLKYTNQLEHAYHPALELKKIGMPAVPLLIDLLEDARPTRSVGFWRPWARGGWTLLRYQDVALQILEGVAGREEIFYTRPTTSSYLSTEPVEYRNDVVRKSKDWYMKRRCAEQVGGEERR